MAEDDFLTGIDDMVEISDEDLDSISGGYVVINEKGKSFDVVDREGKLITTFLGGDNMNEAFRSAIHFARENGYSYYKSDQETLDALRRKHQFGAPAPEAN